VPLDYFDGAYPNHTVSIAITKVPAVVPVSDPRYGGPILTNPGGPGGSGTAAALGVGKALQQIVDTDEPPNISSTDARYFDIIGFDPRGIGWTEPAAQCMPDQASAWSWNLREDNEGLLGSSDAALGRLWSMTHAFGASCKLAEEGQHGPDIKRYMSTEFVARDMLEITERHAEYVAKEIAHVAAQKAGRRVACNSSTYVPGQSKLQYWGFSYGTYLGYTFASMFPDRVGRLILDGVVSSYEYNHSQGNGSLVDAEKALRSFYTFCFNSDPEQCPLTTTNSSVADIEERVLRILDSLYHNPLPIVSSDGPDFLTWSDIKMLIFSSIYQPRFMFPFISRVLAATEVGSGSELNQLAQAYRYNHVYSCPVDHPSESRYLASSIVSTISILCSDGEDQRNLTKDEFAAYWSLVESVSPTFGAYWSMLRMRCAAWNIRASHRFEGTFGANTSNPILFISNTADPVTPLSSGRYMSSLFPGSSLLVSDHAGHCTLSGLDNCVLERVRGYFQTGEVPLHGTVCVPPPSPFSLNSTRPDSPFYDPSLDSASVIMVQEDGMDIKQHRLHDAGVKLQRDVAESGILGLNILGAEKTKRAMRLAVMGRDGDD
jgi:pimeloyl-ACP methyl ester carboxylesterase